MMSAGARRTRKKQKTRGTTTHASQTRESTRAVGGRARRTRKNQKPRVTTTHASQTRDSTRSIGSRARKPRSDWLERKDSTPTRLVSHSAEVQNSRVSSGKTMPASRVAPAAVPDATAAARPRLAISRYTMKMPGVSLIAVARPIPTPPQLLPRAMPNSRSPATSVSSRVLTWPKVIVSRTGSKLSARQQATPKENQSGQSRRRGSGAGEHQGRRVGGRMGGGEAITKAGAEGQ